MATRRQSSARRWPLTCQHDGKIDVVAVEVQDVPPVCDVLPVPILLIPRVERIAVVGHDRAADREGHAAEMVLELPDATVEFGATADYPSLPRITWSVILS